MRPVRLRTLRGHRERVFSVQEQTPVRRARFLQDTLQGVKKDYGDFYYYSQPLARLHAIIV